MVDVIFIEKYCTAIELLAISLDIFQVNIFINLQLK